jgi:hypothetical protein
MIWDIELSQEANNYAIDSHPYNEHVLMAIERLAFSQDGLPTEAFIRFWNTGVSGKSPIIQSFTKRSYRSFKSTFG